MKISDNTKEFIPCPEYTGQGVIVDVTPLKEVDTSFGKRKLFRVVIEVLELNDEGERWCVWSAGFSPTLHEKSGLRKFIKNLYGRDLTKEERDNYETEDLIGMNCFVVVIHNVEGDKTYANIAACTPWKGETIKPSSHFKRAKDRSEEDVKTHRADQPKPAQPKTAPAPKPAPAPEPVDHGSTKVHVGTHKGVELREVDPKSIEKLILLWLPDAKAAAKQSADDKRLIAALEWYIAEREKSNQTADDDVQY